MTRANPRRVIHQVQRRCVERVFAALFLAWTIAAGAGHASAQMLAFETSDSGSGAAGLVAPNLAPPDPAPSTQPQIHTYATASEQQGRLTCPGGFPTDLTVTDCSFTHDQRMLQWINTSFTDQAILGAVVYGLGAEIIKSPDAWGRTWKGYGQRVGVRYTQAAARGTAEFVVGTLLHDDPRHLSYKDDPHTPYGTKIASCKDGVITTVTYPVVEPGVWKRVGHAFVDSLTVLRSNGCGIGKRMPAYSRFVGIAAGTYGGFGWNPRSENTVSAAAQRFGTAYASTLAGSFYTEFSPELLTGLTRLITTKIKEH